MYRVIRAFCDATDKNRYYGVGDTYPAVGVKTPTKARIEALSTGKNMHNAVYIEAVEKEDEKETPEETGKETPEE